MNMTTAINGLIGKRYGRLLVVEMGNVRSHPCGKKYSTWLCECDCGNAAVVSRQHLRLGRVKSCGCLRSNLTSIKNTTHGKSATRAYNVWRGMIDRCTNKNHEAYANYGGRGITVCPPWLSFENFYADMGDPPVAMTLERNDNNNGYSPENCEWASRYKQSRNRRGLRLISFRGETKCLSDWAEELGITRGALRFRLARWTKERALLIKEIGA